MAQAVADYAGTPRYGGKSASALRDEAARMLDGLAGDLSDKRAGRFMVYVVNNLLIRMYHQGIHVNEAQFARVKAVATEAADKGLPLIFLPCHKSHMDYILLGYLFFRLGISMPFIASGDNLNMPVVGTLLRRCGAFFHRRSFADDPLYTAVFKEYVETLLSMGHNIEAFVEGTRSRTGKLLNPKLGILKIITEAVLSGRVKDAYICPISIGYDKVLETESYVNELLGAEKQQESLSQLLNSTRVLALKWGRIDVRFAAPFSLQSYIASQKESRGCVSLINGSRSAFFLSYITRFYALFGRLLGVFDVYRAPFCLRWLTRPSLVPTFALPLTESTKPCSSSRSPTKCCSTSTLSLSSCHLALSAPSC